MMQHQVVYSVSYSSTKWDRKTATKLLHEYHYFRSSTQWHENCHKTSSWLPWLSFFNTMRQCSHDRSTYQTKLLFGALVEFQMPQVGVVYSPLWEDQWSFFQDTLKQSQQNCKIATTYGLSTQLPTWRFFFLSSRYCFPLHQVFFYNLQWSIQFHQTQV